jgi:AraC family L-rhamnose operon regulatory protein RhaS
MPARTLPGVKSIGFWDAPSDQSWGLPWHRNEGLEITLVETGTLGFAVKGEEHLLQPGDLTITRPWQPHCVGNPHVGAGRLHCLILDVAVRQPHQPWKWPRWVVLTEADREELTTMFRHNEQPVWHVGSTIRGCFQRIGQSVQSDNNGSNCSLLTIQLNELLVLLLDMFRRGSISLDATLSGSERTVSLFLADLREHVEDLARPWTVRLMARHCGLGTTRFIYHCRQLTNLTPLQYLNQQRTRAAAQMLTSDPHRSVTAVAMACGFSSSQHFATVFRRCHGLSPKAYRERGLR